MTPNSTIFSPIRWEADGLQLLDQTLLPREEVWIDCSTPEIIAEAIRRLSVRGAPAIGVTAAYGLVVGLKTVGEGQDLEERFEEVSELLGSTRPTAVNLMWALDQGRELFVTLAAQSHEAIIRVMLEWAQRIHTDDIESCQKIGAFGAELFETDDRVLTHCNAGALATGGYGTALGVIQSSFAAGKVALVWVDETRPLLQGARLTSWELQRLEIPFKLITDSSAGSLFSRGLVDRVVVGADRIAANGDTANKIGTYTVAVLADRHNVPFYVAAPLSTIDRQSPTGAAIPIEERDPSEVVTVLDTDVAPANAQAANFAFDVTPNDLIAAIITDVGVLRSPYNETITAAFDKRSKS